MYRMLALDLDGTLLDEECRIPKSTQDLIQAARAQGVVVTLATGRMMQSAKTYALEMGLTHPLVVYNGALIRTASGEMVDVFNSPLTTDEIKRLVSYCRENKLYLQMYSDDEIVVEKRVPETDIDPDLRFAKCREVGDFNACLVSNPDFFLESTPKAMVAVTEDRVNEVPEIKEMLRRSFPALNIVQSRPWLLEILRSDVSKGKSLALLAASLGINCEEVIAVGDSDNDSSMVSWAGLGAAVANATPELKAIARYVATLPSWRGVEEIIERFILSK